ncbi:odorant receptor 67a-like [Drosophila tropicalis]|uniref:odorant receptor 67a-like n=1 Tax=Drosophila tropicalis TaxID=46794 RepID=UPI0035AC203B
MELFGKELTKLTNREIKPKRLYAEFKDFVRLPLFFYHTIGFNPYAEDKKNRGSRSNWLWILFFIHMGVLNFVLACEIIFSFDQFVNGSFVTACETLGYIGFVAVADLKIIAVYFRRATLSNLVNQMESIFPKNQEHEQYDVNRYLTRCRLLTKSFSVLYIVLISLYNMVAYFQYVIDRYIQHSPDAERTMPYVPTVPWNWHNSNLGFYGTYLIQTWAACVSSVGHISADLMIFSVEIQVLMHFDYLSKSLLEFPIQAENGANIDGANRDLSKLQQLIAYHNKILGLTDLINEVFGRPLLLNLLTSSVVVCLVGFQMTIVLSPEQVVKLVLYLISANVEIYLICYFSQLLIEASGGVAFAVYDMNWTIADHRFRKMLVLMAHRAQKPVFLKATVFLDISMETMSMFLRMSYKFFCAIRTMYQ